jgi:hypothetical protein
MEISIFSGAAARICRPQEELETLATAAILIDAA